MTSYKTKPANLDKGGDILSEKSLFRFGLIEERLLSDECVKSLMGALIIPLNLLFIINFISLLLFAAMESPFSSSGSKYKALDKLAFTSLMSQSAKKNKG